MTKPDKIRLPNGGRIQYGQLHQRFPERFAPPGFGRTDGKPKNLKGPATVIGQKHQTADSHAYLHGSPVNDEPLQKNWEGKQVPVHPAMQFRDKRSTEADGFAMLREAGRLGMPPKE
jgi:hypothetical protein